MDRIVQTIEEAVDRVKTSAEPMPTILVGGGGIILPPHRYNELRGVSKIIRPEHYQYANAIGAAIAQASGEIDRIFSLEHMTRDQAVVEAKRMALDEAMRAGVDRQLVEIVEVDEIPLSYLPGNALRLRVKAAGPLAMS